MTRTAKLVRLSTVREYTATIVFGDEPVMNHDRKLLAAELRDRVAEKFIPVLQTGFSRVQS